MSPYAVFSLTVFSRVKCIPLALSPPTVWNVDEISHWSAAAHCQGGMPLTPPEPGSPTMIAPLEGSLHRRIFKAVSSDETAMRLFLRCPNQDCRTLPYTVYNVAWYPTVLQFALVFHSSCFLSLLPSIFSAGASNDIHIALLVSPPPKKKS